MRFVFIRFLLSDKSRVLHLMIASAEGTEPRSLIALSGPDYFANLPPSWSPDGHQVIVPVVVAGKEVHIYAVNSSAGDYYRIPGAWGLVTGTGWLPDGRSFVLAGNEAEGGPVPTQIWQVQLQSGERRRITNDLSLFSGVSVSRDGSVLATVQQAITSQLSFIENGVVRDLTSGRAHDGGVDLAWTADGRLVFTTVRVNSCRTFPARTTPSLIGRCQSP